MNDLFVIQHLIVASAVGKISAEAAMANMWSGNSYNILVYLTNVFIGLLFIIIAYNAVYYSQNNNATRFKTFFAPLKVFVICIKVKRKPQFVKSL